MKRTGIGVLALASVLASFSGAQRVNAAELNSTEKDVTYQTYDSDAGNSDNESRYAEVYAVQSEYYVVSVPADITLDGETGEANYEITCTGRLRDDHKLTVTPDSSFEIVCDGLRSTAEVIQEDTTFTNETFGKKIKGKIKADMRAGEWYGGLTFTFRIENK